MFVIHATNAVDYMNAQHILEMYQVLVKKVIYHNESHIIVDGETREGDEYLCELAFYDAFHQGGNLCPVCRDAIERTGEGESVCGHNTFTKVIQRRRVA